MEDNLKCLSKESHRMLKLGEIHKRAFNLLQFYIKGTESQASPNDGIKPAFPRSTAYKTQHRLYRFIRHSRQGGAHHWRPGEPGRKATCITGTGRGCDGKVGGPGDGCKLDIASSICSGEEQSPVVSHV